MATAQESWEEAAGLQQQMEHLCIGEEPATPAPQEDQAEGTCDSSGAVPSVGLEAGAAGLSHAQAAAVESCDHALRDALSHHKNRHAVLKLEEEVEAFVLGTQDTQHVFAKDMTSYERLLAHRTAQHWGLETTTISQGPDQGKIVAFRGPQTRVPKVKLSDIPVAVNDGTPSGFAAQPSPTSPSPAPRVLVRKRPDRLGPRGGPQDMHLGGIGPYPEGAGPGGFRSVEERQAEYHRARARIFGGIPGPEGYMQQPQPPMHRGGPLYGSGGLPASPVQSHFPMSPPRPVGGGYGGGRGPGGGGWGGGGMGNGGGNGRKAVLRNKHEDLADPDFRRHRNTGPRFDPGFGEEEEAQQSMYIRPTYSSEFPELGGLPSPSGRGGRGRPPQQSPRRGNGGGMPGPSGPMGGAGMGGPGGAMFHPGMPPYGGHVPPGMVAAGHMAPFMVPPGMMLAGPMPGMGGQVAVWNPAAAAGGYYPMPPYAYYAHPMQPGSPMAGGGQDGMGAAAGVPYAAMPYAAYHTMPPPGAAAAMGGFPGGPAAAAAMAAMSAPVPLQMPLSPRGAGAQSPHGGYGRQRTNGTRSRGSSGGHSAASGHASGMAGMQQAQPVEQQAQLADVAGAEAAQQPPPPPLQQQPGDAAVGSQQ